MKQGKIAIITGRLRYGMFLYQPTYLILIIVSVISPISVFELGGTFSQTYPGILNCAPDVCAAVL